MAAEEKPEWLTDTELSWRANQLFFDHMDMSVIEVNLNTETYNLFSEFLADVYTIHHNVAIFHGSKCFEYHKQLFFWKNLKLTLSLFLISKKREKLARPHGCGTQRVNTSCKWSL